MSEKFTFKITVDGAEGRSGGLDLFWLLKNYFDSKKDGDDCGDFWDLGFERC